MTSMPAQPLGGLDGAQRLVVTATSELEHPASVVQGHPGRGFGLGPKGLPGALEPRLCLREPSLADHRAGEHRVSDAGDRLLAPAVPPGQLDRLPAPLRCRRERPEDRNFRPVRQAGELEIGPPDPAGQGDALLEVPLGLVAPEGQVSAMPRLISGQRAPVLAQPGLRRVRSLGRGEQPLRLLDDGREVAALAGQRRAAGWRA